MLVDVSDCRSSILFVYHLLSKANLARFSDRVLTDLLATGRTLGSAVAAREIFSSSAVILHLQITFFSVRLISAKLNFVLKNILVRKACFAHAY